MNVYVYKNKELVKQCNSQSEAARLTNRTQTSISLIIRGIQNKPTFDGYWFATQPLTKEELEDIYDKTRFNRACKEIIAPQQEVEVDCRTRQVFYFPKSKEGKKDMLKRYIYQNLEAKWMATPKQMANLERKFVKDIIDAISK